MTADGKVSTRNFTPTGFTSEADKRRLLEIRTLGDAVLVGAGTLAADTMSLRLADEALQKKRTSAGKSPEPLRVIVSNRGRLEAKAKVFVEDGAPRIVFSTRRMPQTVRSRLAPLADLWLFDTEEVDLPTALQILHQDYAVRTLVCEGGPTLFRSLLEIDAINELRLTWAPVIFGGAKAPTLTGLPGDFLPKSIRARLVDFEPNGPETFLTYRITR